jgi:predicted porin
MRVILVKKTLLVSAVAMAVSSPAMGADFYGNIRLGLTTYTKPATAGPGDLGTDELDVNSGKLVIGSKGSSDLDNGLTVSYGVELEHDRADHKTVGWANDKSWVALGGGWGKVTLGRRGDLAGYACSGTDILTIGSAEACSLGHNTEFDDAIMYTGGTGMFEFGFVYTADGTAADQDIAYGAKFGGESWSVGAQVWENESGNAGAGATQSNIGGTLQLGNIGLGLTYGDNDAATDNTGIDFGFYMPVGPGAVAVVYTTLDADTGIKGSIADGDSIDVEYSQQLGEGAYWGATYNSIDNWDDDRISFWVGTTF